MRKLYPNSSITYRGREVHHPVGRTAIVVLLSFMAVLAFFWMIFGFVLLMLMIPLALLLHYPLRLFGRQGCIREYEHGGTSIVLDGSSFRKA